MPAPAQVKSLWLSLTIFSILKTPITTAGYKLCQNTKKTTIKMLIVMSYLDSSTRDGTLKWWYCNLSNGNAIFFSAGLWSCGSQVNLTQQIRFLTEIKTYLTSCPETLKFIFTENFDLSASSYVHFTCGISCQKGNRKVDGYKNLLTLQTIYPT